jgi:hypothetical protein
VLRVPSSMRAATSPWWANHRPESTPGRCRPNLSGAIAFASEGERGSSQFFTSFAAAAARADEIAAERSAPLMFVEAGAVSLLANYRPPR